MSCMVNRVFIKTEMAETFFEAENLGVMPPRKCLKCRSCADKGQCSESVQTTTDKLGMKEIILHRSKDDEKPLSWDEEVPDEFKVKWKRYIREAAALKQVKFPRGVHPKRKEGPPIIVGYWDGSSRAYAAVIYMVWELMNEENKVSFMCSKAKVTPAKGLTIPKSEMNSLVLCSRLMKTVVTSMPEKPSSVLLVGDGECDPFT